MELIEVSDQNFLSAVRTVTYGDGGVGQNYILQSFNPATHYINGGGARAIEVIDESSPSGTSFVQVVEPSPTVVVNYVIGPNGSLIPVYDNCLSLDNTLTFVTGAPEPYSEPSIPPHILDHMYAKKPKQPGTETTPKPRKRIKKKEPSPPPPPPPPPVVKEYILPEMLSPNTTKVNIIRKGAPQQTFRSMVSPSKPKILQATKPSVQPDQRVASGTCTTTNDLSSSSTPSPLRPFTISSSNAVPSSSTTSRSHAHTKRIVLNNKSQIKSADSVPSSSSTIPSQHQQPPSIYFLPPTASSSNTARSTVLANSDSSTASYLVTTTTENAETEMEITDRQICFVLPSNSSPTSQITPNLQIHPPSDTQNATGQVTTYQLNSDGTISPLPTQSNRDDDDSMTGGEEDHSKQELQNSGAAEEMYTEYSICGMVDDLGGGGASGGGGGIVSSTTGGTFQLGDKQVYFSYE